MRLATRVMIGVLLACAGGPVFAMGYSCPPTVLDKGAVRTADGGADPPWALHEFRRVSFFEGDPKAGPDLPPQDDLKSDRIVQSWDLTKKSAGHITALCRYGGTRATIQAVLPVGLKRCLLITMKEGAAPPEMRCE